MTTLKKIALRMLIGVAAIAVAGTITLAILARVVKRPAGLGVKNGKLYRCPNSPNCVSTQSQDPRHQISPIPYTTSVEEAKSALLQIINSMERTTIIVDEPTYVLAEFKSTGVGYVDDVELYFDEDAGVIHFRSSSRLPYWDWNANRKRMEAIRSAYETTQG